MRTIDELRGKHRGEDIWIIGSGATAGYVDPAFFEGKVTIGINHVHRRFRTSYLIGKDGPGFIDEASTTGIPLIVSEFAYAMRDRGLNDAPNAYYFTHIDHGQPGIFDVIGTGQHTLVTWSTLGSAMHIACEMGAENIILVGCDCGTLDGAFHFPEYSPGQTQAERWRYRQFLSATARDVIIARDTLQKHYGVRIYSLNPFVNLNLEGHKFEGPGI